MVICAAAARHLGSFLMAMAADLFSAAICGCCRCGCRRYPHRMTASQPGGVPATAVLAEPKCLRESTGGRGG
jgi:hypothetical protein